MQHAFADGVLAGYGIAIPVGAIAALIVLEAAAYGFRHGFAAGLGAASADLIYAAVAASTGSALNAQLREVRAPLHIVGGAVLVLIALRGLVAAARHRASAHEERATRDLRKTYLRFLGLTLINPLTVIYFASVVFGNASAATPLRACAFVAGVALASASWQTLLAASGALLGRTALDQARVATAVVGYGIILALGVRQLQLA